MPARISIVLGQSQVKRRPDAPRSQALLGNARSGSSASWVAEEMASRQRFRPPGMDQPCPFQKRLSGDLRRGRSLLILAEEEVAARPVAADGIRSRKFLDHGGGALR